MNNEYKITSITDLHADKWLERRIAVIDADSIAWSVGWFFKDDPTNREAINKAVDDYVLGIFYGTQCDKYVGILAPDKIQSLGIPNFREKIAHKDRPYKGNRPPKPEWYVQIAPIIEDRLIHHWRFIQTPAGYEADDCVATMITCLKSQPFDLRVICCGVDKDLLQIPGEHYNLKTKAFSTVDEDEANFSLWLQVIMGDSTDGIPGVPKVGIRKATKLLKDYHSDIYNIVTLEFYIQTFGEYEGIKRFYETYMLVKLNNQVPIPDNANRWEYLDIDKVNEYIGGIKEAQEIAAFEEAHEDLMYFKEDDRNEETE